MLLVLCLSALTWISLQFLVTQRAASFTSGIHRNAALLLRSSWRTHLNKAGILLASCFMLSWKFIDWDKSLLTYVTPLASNDRSHWAWAQVLLIFLKLLEHSLLLVNLTKYKGNLISFSHGSKLPGSDFLAFSADSHPSPCKWETSLRTGSAPSFTQQ